MLYYLSNLSGEFSVLNIFSYITFRAGAALLCGLLIALLISPKIIAKLRAHKIGQIERDDGPKSHLKKSGTPTMGGIIILISLLTSVLLWARLDNNFIWLLITVTIILACAGFVDDYTKLIKKNTAGAPSWLKFAAQMLAALIVVAYLGANPPNSDFATSLTIPYFSSKVMLNLGVFYSAFAMLVIIGSSNATNLTDGLDGLASGSVIFCAGAYIIFAYMAGNMGFAEYLKIVPVPGAGEIAVFLSALVGACLGFLWYNAYPAQVFMGDTSSLFLGGVIATSAICIKQELVLVIAGGLFVMEALSVIIQMGYFKLTKGKRIFKMAPLHHHFELKGVAEPKVIVRFWIIGIILMLLALSTLKIR